MAIPCSWRSTSRTRPRTVEALQRASAVIRPLVDPVKSAADEPEPGVVHPAVAAADLLAFDLSIQHQDIPPDQLVGEAGLPFWIVELRQGEPVRPGVDLELVERGLRFVRMLDGNEPRPLENQPAP